MEGENMDERRQLPRWEIKREAKVRLLQTQGLNHGIIEDMHLKGMCISFDKQLLPQEPVRISFAIGDSFDFIKVEAQIPWSKEEQGRYVYGLLFSTINDRSMSTSTPIVMINSEKNGGRRFVFC
jgi:hypothetical protein